MEIDLKLKLSKKFDYTCQNCKKRFSEKSDSLRIHRIDNSLDYDEKNLTLVCKRCKKLFSRYNNRPNKRESIKDKIDMDLIKLNPKPKKKQILFKIKDTSKISLMGLNKKGEFKSIFILDTNIILYKIYGDLEVNGKKIWRDDANFRLVKDKLDKITNEGNLIIITPVVVDEINKLWESKFDEMVYNKKFYGVRLKEIKKAIKKRIEKLIDKYAYNHYFQEIVITEKNVDAILSVYSMFEEDLRKITEKKVFNLPEDIKERKLSYRLNGYMPEQSDIDLLAECMYIRQNLEGNFNKVKLFTFDSDFTHFIDPIRKLLFVEVYCLNSV